MKHLRFSLLISLALLFCIGATQKISDANAATPPPDDGRYVMFIGAGEVGDPIITWQKIGDQVTKPTIFTEQILKKTETLPLIIVTTQQREGQLSPGVEELIRAYRQKNNENPSVLIFDKAAIAQMDASFKEQLKSAGLVFKNNKIEVESPDLYKKSTLKTRLSSKLKDSPTMATMLLKASLQAFSCYFAIKFTGMGKDLSPEQILAFIGLNMAVTIGINSFIEEFIKLRTAAAQGMSNIIDKVFDALKNIREYIGDITARDGQERLIRATLAMLAEQGNVTSKSFDNTMRNIVKFAIKGDMAMQTGISATMMMLTWLILDVKENVYTFANQIGLEGQGLSVVVLTGIVLAVINSFSGVPIDLLNSYFNKMGVFKNKVSIYFSLFMECIWQKDKFSAVGLVWLNNAINTVLATVSLPAYLFAHYAVPATKVDEVALNSSQEELNKVISDVAEVFNTQPEIKEEVLALQRLQKRDRSKLGIGFIDKLMAKPDTQLLLDLTYLLQKYMDDGTFQKMVDIEPKLSKKVNVERIKNLLETLKTLRDSYAETELNTPLSKEDLSIIKEAETAVNKARDFNSLDSGFWKECGINLKKVAIKLLKVVGWKNPQTAEQKVEALLKAADDYEAKGKPDLYTEANIENLIKLAATREYIEQSRNDLTQARNFAKKIPNNQELNNKITKAERKILLDGPRKELVQRILKILYAPDAPEDEPYKGENYYPTDDAVIFKLAEYVTNVANGALTTTAITKAVIGEPEKNFENGAIYQLGKIISAMEQPQAKQKMEVLFKNMRTMILCNNDYFTFGTGEDDKIGVVKFLTSEYTVDNITENFVGNDKEIVKLDGTDFLSPEMTTAISKEKIKTGLVKFSEIMENMKIIKR